MYAHELMNYIYATVALHFVLVMLLLWIWLRMWR